VSKLQVLLSPKFEYVISNKFFTGLTVADNPLGKTEESIPHCYCLVTSSEVTKPLCYIMETKHACVFSVTFHLSFLQISMASFFMATGGINQYTCL